MANSVRVKAADQVVTGTCEVNCSGMAISKELLAILVCPESHATLIEVGDWLYSTDPKTRRRYPVRNGIPVMLVDESEVVAQADFEQIVARHGVSSARS